MAKASDKAKEAQAKEQAKRASLDDLKAKKPLEKAAVVYSGDEPLEIVFRSIGRKRYSRLIEECSEEVERDALDEKGKPTGEKETDSQLDEERFIPRLVAESSHDPKLDEETVHSFVDEWNATEFDELAMAAYEVNIRNKVEAKGKG